MDLGLGLEETVVIITGAGGQIGSIILEAFLAANCYVGALDIDASKFIKQHDRLVWILADTTNESDISAAWEKVKNQFGSYPTVCVCAAALDLSFIEHHESSTTMSTEQFRKTTEVNVVGTFITAREWLRHIPKRLATKQSTSESSKGSGHAATNLQNRNQNISLIIIGSEAGTIGVPGNPDYAASKSAVQYGLVLSLAPDAARVHPQARVNAICPGAVDTAQFRQECAQDPSGSSLWKDAEATVASHRPVSAEDVAKLCVTLASEKWSGSTTGQTLRIDCGKNGRLYWDKNGHATW